MRCADCKYYEPARNPDTGRQLPSKDGDCVYPVEWPTLPKSFLPDRWHFYGSMRRVEFPQRQSMWKNNDEPCETFEARPAKAKAKAAVQIALTMPGEAKTP